MKMIDFDKLEELFEQNDKKQEKRKKIALAEKQEKRNKQKIRKNRDLAKEFFENTDTEE
jgi:hypothetical protein